MSVRVTAQYIQYATTGNRVGLRVAAQHVEVAATVDLDPSIRVAAQHVEVAGDVAIDNAVRMTAQIVEVVRASDHRGLTGMIGTIGSGLATETLQLGAGSQGASFFEPENTGQVGSRSSLAGGHLVPGRSVGVSTLIDTGEIGVNNAVLNFTHILGFGSATGEKLVDAPNTLVLTQSANAIIEVSLSALTDIDMDGTWTTPATSNIKSKFGVNTLTLGTVADNNQKFAVAENTIAATQSAAPGQFVLFANNTIVLTLDVDSGIAEGAASSFISLSTTTDVQTSILTVDAENTLAMVVASDNNFFVVSAENTLALTQSESVAGPTATDTSNAITVTDTADVTFNVFGRAADNTIVFFGFNPDDFPASPAPGWDTVTSNIRSLAAETPDRAGEPPESDQEGFTQDWVQGPRLADTFEASASNAITITDELPQPTGKRSVSAENTLSLLDFADNQIKNRVVEVAIEITQTATADKAFRAVNTLAMVVTTEEGFVNLFAENIIELDHIGRPNPHVRGGINTLAMTNTATSSIRVLSASNTLVLGQDINVLRPYRVDAENVVQGTTSDIFLPPLGPIIPGVPFGLDHEATLQINAVRNPTNLIPIAHSAQAVHILVDAVDLTATTVIGLVQLANLSITGAAVTTIDTLVVTTNVDLNTSDATTPIDGLTDTALFSIGRALLPADNVLHIKHAVGFSLIRDTTDCDYSPFVGVSDAGTQSPSPTLPSPKVPALDPSIRFRLVYPPFDVGEATDTLDLRAPSFGNRERLEATRISRETVGGTLTVFADPIWPKVHSLQMQFKALKTDQARGLLDFMERWLGQEIGIYDYEGRLWRGVITNPDEAVTHDGKESYSANLDIEAERIHTEVRIGEVASTINVSQTADFVFALGEGASPIDIAGVSDYTRVPVREGSNAVSLSQFATRNSFFFESASSPISLGQDGAELDFDDFGNLIHNWDAENTAGATGDPLSSWADLGSSPVTLNATGGQEPTVRDSILNGRRVVEFRHAGLPQRLISAANIPLFDLINKVGTIFIVTIVREVLGSGNEIILGNNSDKVMLGGTTSTERPVILQSSEANAALETPQSVLGNGTTQLLMIRRDNNDITFRRNKVAEAGTTWATNPAPVDEQLYFGGFSGAGNSVDQDIAHVLMYDDMLSDEDIETIEGLLTAKWGV